MRCLKVKDGRSCVIRIDLVKKLTVMMVEHYIKTQ